MPCRAGGVILAGNDGPNRSAPFPNCPLAPTAFVAHNNRFQPPPTPSNLLSRS